MLIFIAQNYQNVYWKHRKTSVFQDLFCLSTPKKTQYGKDVNVGKLCEDTIMKPDEVIYNKDQNVMIYKKEYPFNISTSDTPTGTHRVFIPLNTQGKKTIRMSQFPLVGGNWNEICNWNSSE